MNYNYSIELLNKVLSDFSAVTGNNIALYDTQFNRLGKSYANHQKFCALIHSNPEGRRRCVHSDKELLSACAMQKTLQTHVCHAGLTDICIPIKHNDLVIAYVVLGQIKNDISLNDVVKKLGDLNFDYNEIKECYESINYSDNEKIKSVISVAIMLSEYILYNDMIKPRYNKNVELATVFIDENYKSEITVDDICKAANVSKSVLYKNFNSYLGITPVEYINRKRVEKACTLLQESKLSIENVMLSSGFSNQSYFYKRFKEQKGVTPKKYRLQNKIKK